MFYGSGDQRIHYQLVLLMSGYHTRRYARFLSLEYVIIARDLVSCCGQFHCGDATLRV